LWKIIVEHARTAPLPFATQPHATQIAPLTIEADAMNPSEPDQGNRNGQSAPAPSSRLVTGLIFAQQRRQQQRQLMLQLQQEANSTTMMPGTASRSSSTAAQQMLLPPRNIAPLQQSDPLTLSLSQQQALLLLAQRQQQQQAWQGGPPIMMQAVRSQQERFGLGTAASAGNLPTTTELARQMLLQSHHDSQQRVDDQGTTFPLSNELRALQQRALLMAMQGRQSQNQDTSQRALRQGLETNATSLQEMAYNMHRLRRNQVTSSAGNADLPLPLETTNRAPTQDGPIDTTSIFDSMVQATSSRVGYNSVGTSRSAERDDRKRKAGEIIEKEDDSGSGSTTTKTSSKASAKKPAATKLPVTDNSFPLPALKKTRNVHTSTLLSFHGLWSELDDSELQEEIFRRRIYQEASVELVGKSRSIKKINKQE